MWRDFSKMLRELLELPGENARSYRPDLHYMRGPGPKWHAKYGHLVSKPVAAPSPARRMLSDITERPA